MYKESIPCTYIQIHIRSWNLSKVINTKVNKESIISSGFHPYTMCKIVSQVSSGSTWLPNLETSEIYLDILSSRCCTPRLVERALYELNGDKPCEVKASTVQF